MKQACFTNNIAPRTSTENNHSMSIIVITVWELTTRYVFSANKVAAGFNLHPSPSLQFTTPSKSCYNCYRISSTPYDTRLCASFQQLLHNATGCYTLLQYQFTHDMTYKSPLHNRATVKTCYNCYRISSTPYDTRLYAGLQQLLHIATACYTSLQTELYK